MNALPPPRDAPPLPTNVELLRTLARVKQLRRSNSLRSFKSLSTRRRIVSGALLIPGGIFLFLSLVLAMGIRFGQATSSSEAEHLLSTMLLVTLATSLAGCLSTALQSLFMNSEIRFLVSLPIPMRLIFYDRFGEVARGALPGALFGMAVCLGFVLGRAEQYTFFLIALIAITLLSATAIALSAGITAIIVRFAPPRRARSVLVATSLLVLLATTATWRKLDIGGTDESRSDSTALRVIALLPSGWAKEAMVRAIGDQPVTSLPFLGLQVGVLMLVAAAGAATFASTFSRNLERTDMREINAVPRAAPRLARRILRLVPLRFLHWVKREWLLGSRDFARISAAILPVATISLWVVSTLVWSGPSGHSPGEHFWLTHSPLLLLPWGMSLGTTVFTFGAEGRAFDMIRTLPVGPGTLMMGKYIAYAVPITGLSLGIATLSLGIQPGSRQDSYLLIILVALLSASFCAIDLSMAASSPRFDSEHVQRATGFFARMISTVLGLLTALLLAGGLAISPLGREGVHSLLSMDSIEPPIFVWAAALAVGAAIPAVLFMIGTSRLRAILTLD